MYNVIETERCEEMALGDRLCLAADQEKEEEVWK